MQKRREEGKEERQENHAAGGVLEGVETGVASIGGTAAAVTGALEEGFDSASALTDGFSEPPTASVASASASAAPLAAPAASFPALGVACMVHIFLYRLCGKSINW